MDKQARMFSSWILPKGLLILVWLILKVHLSYGEGMIDLNIPGESYTEAVSADGSIIIGTVSTSGASASTEPFKYDTATRTLEN
ncbi:hypothetical protein [Candidatus Chlamydia sanziniae]|nr:hypothetical protein [Candidatus Chlamydia sanziniae]